MVTIVSSRFAGLQIEDDDDEFRKTKPKSKPNNTKPKASSATKAKGSNQSAHLPQKKQKAKPQKNKSLNESEQKEQRDQKEQWSKWQEKDSELVEKSYMTDLEQALLLSKLDFEANKTKYTQYEKEAQQPIEKVKKPKTLSLQEFQEQVSKDVLEKERQRQLKQAEEEFNRNHSFFDQIDLETKQIVSKEQIKSLFQAKDLSSKSKNIIESRNKLNQDDALSSELEKLKADNFCLREEITVLRDRYKKVVSMLKSGGMKDKTELMIEIEKLKKIQDDMTTEMTVLYGELEQAKSKFYLDGKGKEKATTRRQVRFDASSECANH